MNVQFLVLRTATEDRAYYAVERGSGRAWVYDTTSGRLAMYASLQDAPLDSSKPYVRNEISPDDIPARVRAGFGAALKAAVEEAIVIARLMGVDAAPPGVSNYIGGVGDSASVIQGRDMRMPHGW